MARARYLADTSVLSRYEQSVVAEAMRGLTAQSQVAVCAPVVFELGRAARSPREYLHQMSDLGEYEMAPVTQGDHQRALAVQQALASNSRHRGVSVVDAMVAAVAETRKLVVLHYDSDFELISEVTGQPTEWVVERGTADSN